MHERDANFTEPIPARLRPNRLRIVSQAKIAMDKFARLRRVIIAVIGFTVLLIGVALVVLPGPAIVVIPLGLAILATEFVWARRLLQRARATFGKKESQAEKESPNRLA